MLPWQKKKQEQKEMEAERLKKEFSENKTGVIDGKTINEAIIKDAVTPKEEKQPETELDAIEIGLINNHRADQSIQLHMIEVLEKIYDKLEEMNKKS